LPAQDATAWITAQRPSRLKLLDPFQPHAFFLEEPEAEDGKSFTSAAIFLTNKECPWRCLMCDLWKNTTTQSVPPGAIPRQIEYALARLPGQPEQIKLYNSGSFFDPGAIPPADYGEIARLTGSARRVVVETHPRLVGEKALRFQGLLAGSLEVALGLETVHPQVLPRLNKKFTLDQFSQASAFLRAHGMSVRVFILVKPPFLDEDEGVEWAVKSAAFALSRGATVVSLIPTRPGNGALERLMETGQFSPPKLSSLEKALDLSLKLGGGRILADTWDLAQFSSCAACLEKRRQRLQAMNLCQQSLPAVDCEFCGGS
jgi:hypothetical protein